ncbi:MAG: type II toxin-antitoxin system HigB family toxin [Heteroscytonema crispum UTEX LB 1556]
MRVISKKTGGEFWESHPNAQPGLLLWYQRLCDLELQNFNDVRQIFSSADLVGNFIVFNIGGIR